MPSGRFDVVTQITVLENNTCVISPWSSEIVVVWSETAVEIGNVGVVNHIPGIDSGACTTRCGNSSVGNGTDIVVLEPGESFLTEDEINGSDDQALGVELVTGLGENGVLVTPELGGVVTHVGGVGGESKVLSIGVDVTECVLDDQVVHFGVGVVGTESGG